MAHPETGIIAYCIHIYEGLWISSYAFVHVDTNFFVDWKTIEDVEAFLFGVESFNNNKGPWAGQPLLSGHLGIIIFDSCTNALLAANRLAQFLSGKLELFDEKGRRYDPKKVSSNRTMQFN